MRKLRNLQPGATYHVASKIDHGAMALKDPAIKRVFLDMVVIAKTKFPFQLWNFTILDNHIHFLIKPGPGVSLSKIMQWLKCNFAKKWNKIHHTTGHLWGDRFFSRIINNAKDFIEVNDYIDGNPVEAGLVPDATMWPFGGLFHRLRGIREILDDLQDEFPLTLNLPLTSSP
jgi:putative transposase